MKLLSLIMLLMLASCSTVQQPFEPESFKQGLYRKDMKITANGYSGHGFVVAPKADKYRIRIKAMGKLDLFTITSCHREITQEDAGYKGKFLGFGRDNKRTDLEYVPAKNIEDNGSCPVELGGYEKKKGRHSWGFFVSEHSEATLPSVVKCNGRDTQYRGVSGCQSRHGLIQRIEFPVAIVFQVPIEYSKNSDFRSKGLCQYSEIKLIDNNKILEYKMPKGECMLYFQEVGDAGRLAEHYDWGYTKIMIK